MREDYQKLLQACGNTKDKGVKALCYEISTKGVNLARALAFANVVKDSTFEFDCGWTINTLTVFKYNEDFEEEYEEKYLEIISPNWAYFYPYGKPKEKAFSHYHYKCSEDGYSY